MTTDDSRTKLLNFAGMAAVNSSSLQSLHLENTCSSAEDGERLMQMLADDAQLNCLQHLTINCETAWFDYGDRDECMAQLLVLLTRQTNLKTLTMERNGLSED